MSRPIFWYIHKSENASQPDHVPSIETSDNRAGQCLVNTHTHTHTHTHTYIYIYIIISCRQLGYPWPSLATSPYYSSPLAGLQGYILCHHIAAVCKFQLVVLLLLGHMWGSIGVHHLWARPCFSSSVLRVWFVYIYIYIYIYIYTTIPQSIALTITLRVNPPYIYIYIYIYIYKF